MRISEIDSKYNSNKEAIRELQKQVAALSVQNNELAQLKESKLLDYFSEWIEIGSEYHINNYFNIKAVQTGLKAGQNSISPFLKQGDIIQFTKKNPKSIIIKVTTKINIKVVDGQRISETIHPNWTYRVDTKELYDRIMRDSESSERFKTYVIRKESLELLGI